LSADQMRCWNRIW